MGAGDHGVLGSFSQLVPDNILIIISLSLLTLLLLSLQALLATRQLVAVLSRHWTNLNLGGKFEIIKLAECVSNLYTYVPQIDLIHDLSVHVFA